MIIATAQFTIIDLSDPVISSTQPPSPSKDMLWLDTSVTPNTLKRWDGEKWVVVNDTNELNNKVQTLQTDFKVEQGRIQTLIKDTTIDGTKLKDKYLETVQTVDGINTTIKNVQSDVDSLDTKVTKISATTEGIKTEVSQAKTDAKNALDKVNSIEVGATNLIRNANTMLFSTYGIEGSVTGVALTDNEGYMLCDDNNILIL